MQIKLESSAYSSKFYDVIHSWDRYIIAYGGRGSGKTDSFYLKYLLSLFEPYYFRLAYINKEGSNIRDQQYAGFKRVAKRSGLDHLLKFYDGDYRILNPDNGNALIPKGMDDPEKTKGMDDITAIWWDEINKGTLDDFTALNALLRSPKSQYLQFALSFNPVFEEHWLRTTFFSKDDSHQLHPDFVGNTLLNRSTFRDNEFIDQEAYYNTLVMNAVGNPNRIRVDVDGDWGLLENKNPWLSAFNDTKHVSPTPLPLIPNLPIHLSFDFNISPLTCIVGQHSNSYGPGAFVRIIKEYKLHDMDIGELCKRIKADFPFSVMTVTGDATGRARNAGYTSGDQNMWSMIQAKLKLSPGQILTPLSNPSWKNSRFLCNTLMQNHPNYLIDPSCKTLINDCTIAKPKPTTNPDEEDKLYKEPGNSQYGMHMFDTFRYYNNTHFVNFVKTS